MNAKIEAHVSEWLKSQGQEATHDNVIEAIKDQKPLWKGDEDHRRWWTQWSYVVEINGMLIMYTDATSDGDENAYDRGYEFDEESICEAEAVTRTVTEYKAKQN